MSNTKPRNFLTTYFINYLKENNAKYLPENILNCYYIYVKASILISHMCNKLLKTFT